MVNTTIERLVTEFQGKDPSEQVEFYFRQHWIRMLWPFTKVSIFTAIILITAFMSFSVIDIEQATVRHTILLFLLAFFLIVHFEFLVRFYRYFLYVVVVTDRRIHRIKKTLLTIDEHECVDLVGLQEIRKHQHGIIQNMLHFGSLTLEAQDTHLTLHFVPQITKRSQGMMVLWERTRAMRRRRGEGELAL